MSSYSNIQVGGEGKAQFGNSYTTNHYNFADPAHYLEALRITDDDGLISASRASPSQQINKPHYYIPLHKNQRFVGRQDTLDALKSSLFTQGQPRAALVGLGGIGKTQVALELAYWVKENKPDHSVFWVPALSNSTFEQAYAEMAMRLAVHKDSDKEDVKEAVQRHLSCDAVGPWLLVVDNADDKDLVLGGSATPGGICQHLPKSERGVILYTTRSEDVALAVAGENTVELHTMDQQEAKTVLEKWLPRKDLKGDDTEIARLLEELTYLPLAITQAAAYMKRNRISVTRYLSLLRGAEKDTVNLLSSEFPDSHRYTNSRNAVATTWLVSFDQIRRTDGDANNLLSFISCVEPKAIPLSLLPDFESEVRMDNAIGTLCGYAFINRRDDRLLDMHSLVHLATQIWVQKCGIVKQTIEVVVRRIDVAFPLDNYANRDLWREYFPHAFHVLRASEAWDIHERYNLMYKLGRCLYRDRRFDEAIKLFEEIHERDKEHLLQDDPERLLRENWLGSAYLNNRRVKEAIGILEHALAGRKKTLAEDAYNRLASEHQLARAYVEDKRVKEAIDIFERVVTVWKKSVAEENYFRLMSEQELARAYLEDGQIEKGIDILENVAAVRKRTLTEDEHVQLVPEYELGRAYLEGGRVKEAINILEHVVALRKRTLAEESRFRIASENELARAYLQDGRITEAIDIFEHVVAVSKRTSELEDDERLLTQKWLAYALKLASRRKVE